MYLVLHGVKRDKSGSKTDCTCCCLSLFVCCIVSNLELLCLAFSGICGDIFWKLRGCAKMRAQRPVVAFYKSRSAECSTDCSTFAPPFLSYLFVTLQLISSFPDEGLAFTPTEPSLPKPLRRRKQSIRHPPPS